MLEKYKLFIISVLLMASVLFFSCSGEELETENKKTSYCLPESMAEKIEIEVAHNAEAYRILNLPGQITVNKDKVYRLYPAAGGVISEVHVRMGDEVKKGQALATIQSPDIAAFKRDKLSAESYKSISKRNLEMAESLHDVGVYSQRDLKKAKSTFEGAVSELNRLRELQKVLGLIDNQTNYTIRAPEAGIVVERNINPGMTLRSDDEHVFTISDLRDVWVIANVAESDISNVNEKDTVTISTMAYPNKKISGEIVRLSNAVNPESRTMEAIVELMNTDYLLKPGMFANVFMKVNTSGIYPAINSNALIFDNNRYYVVVYSSNCDLEVREVEVSSQNGEKAFIRSGIEAGEKIVYNQHLLIYNELNMQKARR